MIHQVFDRKITVLILAVILLVYNLTGIAYANEVSGVPHFHNNTTSRSVAENESIGTNVGSAVSAHSRGTYGRYILGGTDAESFTINEDNGQLKTKTVLDYETKSSYTVTVTIQRGRLSPLSDSITGPIIVYSDADSITVTINVTNSTDTSCPTGYVLQNNDCLLIVSGVGFGEADALPSITSEEAARITSLLTMDQVIFNELFNASNNINDWVEFRNVTDMDLDLSGWRVIIATKEATTAFDFPEGTILPAGEVLLFLNTDPSHPDMPLASSEDAPYIYLVDEAFVLPQAAFTLLLRSRDAWKDTVGNYFFGYDAPPTAPPLTPDVAWARVKPGILGSRSEAWVSSNYQSGLGYDDSASEDTSLGTPGYHRQEMLGDANGDGIVNILDLVWVASQIGQSDETSADVNNDGIVNIQDLVVIANGLRNVAAAPSAQSLTAVQVEQWLNLATQEVSRPIQTSLSQREFSYERGIQVLERLLQSLIPKSTALLPNYPNPFNPETWIPYHLATASDVQITIYDKRGSVVRLLNLGHQREGYYTSRSRAAYWDGRNEVGESVASGMYFYQLQANNTSTLRKMVILK